MDELRRFLVIILGLTIPLLAGLLIRLDAPRAQIDAWTPGMLEPADGAV